MAAAPLHTIGGCSQLCIERESHRSRSLHEPAGEDSNLGLQVRWQLAQGALEHAVEYDALDAFIREAVPQQLRFSEGVGLIDQIHTRSLAENGVMAPRPGIDRKVE